MAECADGPGFRDPGGWDVPVSGPHLRQEKQAGVTGRPPQSDKCAPRPALAPLDTLAVTCHCGRGGTPEAGDAVETGAWAFPVRDSGQVVGTWDPVLTIVSDGGGAEDCLSQSSPA